MADYKTIIQKLDQLSADIELLDRFLHGVESETVLLGQVSTPTIRNLVGQLRSGIASLENAVADARRYAERAAETLTRVRATGAEALVNIGNAQTDALTVIGGNRADALAAMDAARRETLERVEWVGDAQVTRVSESGTVYVERAREAADAASNAASHIESVAGNRTVLMGWGVDTDTMTLYRETTDGEETDGFERAKYEAWDLLPAWARLYVNPDGHLTLELPFTRDSAAAVVITN